MGQAYDDIYNEPRIKYFSFTDASFVAGDSPVTHDVFAVLGKVGIDGHIKCDGAGNISVEISHDGVTFGQAIVIKTTETMSLKPLRVNKVRVTHVADSSYRLFVI